MKSLFGKILIAAAVGASLAAFASAGALAGTVSRSVTLKSGASKQTITLAPISKMTVYSVSILAPKKVNLKVDLRGKSGSITYPGIFSTAQGEKKLSIYTYRPLTAGRYSVVLQKKAGSSAKVTVKVTSKVAAQPRKK